jgi:membrane protein implicated in regulation of membrane protease activity
VAWYWWVLAGLLLLVVEMLSIDLIFVMMAAGAFAAAIVSLFTDSIVAESLVAVAVAGGALLLVRPVALRHLTLPHSLRTGTAALVGAEGLVLERVDGRDGRIKIGGEIWSARAYDRDSVFEPGTSVEVARIDGATALVYSMEP